jgi:hypothetical protein
MPFPALIEQNTLRRQAVYAENPAWLGESQACKQAQQKDQDGLFHNASVSVIDQVYDQLYHDVFFFGFALGGHNGNSHQGIVADAFAAVGPEQCMVFVKKIDE